MSETAAIYTYSVIHSSTESFKDKVPYMAAIVTRPDGSRIATLVEGYSPDKDVAIGSKVVLSGTDTHGNPIYRLV
jgi:uncharacterized OB-fold protein